MALQIKIELLIKKYSWIYTFYDLIVYEIAFVEREKKTFEYLISQFIEQNNSKLFKNFYSFIHMVFQSFHFLKWPKVQ